MMCVIDELTNELKEYTPIYDDKESGNKRFGEFKNDDPNMIDGVASVWETFYDFLKIIDIENPTNCDYGDSFKCVEEPNHKNGYVICINDIPMIFIDKKNFKKDFKYLNSIMRRFSSVKTVKNVSFSPQFMELYVHSQPHEYFYIYPVKNPNKKFGCTNHYGAFLANNDSRWNKSHPFELMVYDPYTHTHNYPMNCQTAIDFYGDKLEMVNNIPVLKQHIEENTPPLYGFLLMYHQPTKTAIEYYAKVFEELREYEIVMRKDALDVISSILCVTRDYKSANAIGWYDVNTQWHDAYDDIFPSYPMKFSTRVFNIKVDDLNNNINDLKEILNATRYDRWNTPCGSYFTLTDEAKAFTVLLNISRDNGRSYRYERYSKPCAHIINCLNDQDEFAHINKLTAIHRSDKNKFAKYVFEIADYAIECNRAYHPNR